MCCFWLHLFNTILSFSIVSTILSFFHFPFSEIMITYSDLSSLLGHQHSPALRPQVPPDDPGASPGLFFGFSIFRTQFQFGTQTTKMQECEIFADRIQPIILEDSGLIGVVAQLVERTLRMREAWSSTLHCSKVTPFCISWTSF